MPEEWTGTLIGKMHNSNVTRVQLANQLGIKKPYITMILNGSRKPKGAQERLEQALSEIIQSRKE